MGHDVVFVGQTDLRGKPDEDLIGFCNTDNRVLVTLDLGISELSNRLTTGLVLMRIPRRVTSDVVVKLLRDLVSASGEDELRGRITVVSPGRRTRSRMVLPGPE